MQLIRRSLVAALGFFILNVHAQVVPQAGVEYRLAAQPQAVNAGKKVEVIEFFGYFCPGCNAFEPYFEEWIKRQGDRIVVKRMHSDLHELTTQQKLYFTLEAMGKVDELQLKVFNAFHIDRNRLSTDAEVMKFVEKNGLDKKRFFEIYSNAFAMDSKLRSVKQAQSVYQIDGIPTVIIDGKYIVSPLEVGAKIRSADKTPRPGLVVMDYLVDKVYKEKNPVASTSSTAATPKKK